MDGVRDDIQKNAQKKAQELKKYFDNLDRSTNKRCGFFGLIVKCLKAMVTGDWKSALEGLKDVGSILKDVAQIAAVVLAVVAAAAVTVASGGTGAGLLALAVVGAVLVISGMAMNDPGIMEMIMEALPEDQQQKAAIALAVVGAVLALAGGVMMGCATGGSSVLATVSTVVTSISGLISAGVTVEQGVKGYQASEHKADSLKNLADVDITEAAMTDLKGVLERNQKDLKALYDAFANALSSTRDMITQYGQNLNRAAAV
jgi:enamine deaminase RidA (YjgF/YER057c/UK114 family)